MNATAGRFTVDSEIPESLTKQELAEGLGYSVHQIDEFRRHRNHPAIKQLDAPGHPRFSGRVVKQWLAANAGESADPRRRHFFGAAAGKVAAR